jgi:hypothetical protein
VLPAVDDEDWAVDAEKDRLNDGAEHQALEESLSMTAHGDEVELRCALRDLLDGPALDDLTVSDHAGFPSNRLRTGHGMRCLRTHRVDNLTRVDEPVPHHREQVDRAEKGKLGAKGFGKAHRLVDGPVAARATVNGHENLCDTIPDSTPVGPSTSTPQSLRSLPFPGQEGVRRI